MPLISSIKPKTKDMKLLIDSDSPKVIPKATRSK